MSKKQIDVYRTGIYLRLSQGDEDIDGLEKKESNSISNQKLLLEGFIDAHDDLKLVDIFGTLSPERMFVGCFMSVKVSQGTAE